MKKVSSKILLIFLSALFFYSCSVVKRVPEGKQLLVGNQILVNNAHSTNDDLYSLLYQKPNGKLLGYPLRLVMYNAAKENPDSLYQQWLYKKPNRKKRLIKLLSKKQVDRLGQSFIVSGWSKFLKKTGQAPVIINQKKIEKSKNKLQNYFHYNLGYFRAKVTTKIDSSGNKKATVTYAITTEKPYFLDTLSHYIETPKLIDLYKKTATQSYLKKGTVFSSDNFAKERQRLTTYFRNNGAYHFQVNNVKFDIDTLASNYKVNVTTSIEDRTIKKGDTLVKTPFKLYTIKKVNLYVLNHSNKQNFVAKDSVLYNNYHIYSDSKLKYKPKALLNAVFIEKDSLFNDISRTLTSQAINKLKQFHFPTIEYREDTLQTNALIASIYLAPKKKFNLLLSSDFTHSNIQDFGISGTMSFTFRNVFRGAESLEITTRGNIGSSRDLANPNEVFFNIAEYGADVKLTFPRIFFPLNTSKIITKKTLPSTQIGFGFTNQRNIGLDKESSSGQLQYNWTTKNKNKFQLEFMSLNYVRNLNIGNYFNVYTTSYNSLNNFAGSYNTNTNYLNSDGNLTTPGALNFMTDVVAGNTSLTTADNDYKTILSIYERYYRLTENNFIASASFSFNRSTKQGILDKNYYNFRTKIESAGNLLGILVANFSSSKTRGATGSKKLFGTEYAQYMKGEIEYVKHWDLGDNTSFALRSFAGIAIPYGNSNFIPFSRSYFAGGSNDNRGWQAYSLGPGKSSSILDFNEANMKLATSLEYRFNFFGNLNGALFADAGNIWNIYDNIDDTDFTFNGFSSLKDLALGSGIGFRYDFTYFVFRIDCGYKIYNPAKTLENRWLKDIKFGKTVLNFGINYPF